MIDAPIVSRAEYILKLANIEIKDPNDPHD
jgi:hypothetical protein